MSLPLESPRCFYCIVGKVPRCTATTGDNMIDRSHQLFHPQVVRRAIDKGRHQPSSTLLNSPDAAMKFLLALSLFSSTLIQAKEEVRRPSCPMQPPSAAPLRSCAAASPSRLSTGAPRVRWLPRAGGWDGHGRRGHIMET